MFNSAMRSLAQTGYFFRPLFVGSHARLSAVPTKDSSISQQVEANGETRRKDTLAGRYYQLLVEGTERDSFSCSDICTRQWWQLDPAARQSQDVRRFTADCIRDCKMGRLFAEIRSSDS
jgi:hypothetical protein